ncbi:hypothetical protein [Rufibacter ruber]|uniref:hypothetical protein n=1 Tax=Rufibacter ruber TaxID=1783499 RepID=UPI000832F923|nr:hypothetical protein [Rufibacter ruber]
MQRHLIYQAYGKEDILHELLYSLYSLLKLYPAGLPCQVVVYTDNEAYLRQFLPETIAYRQLSAAQIQEWRGPQDFVHRVKIMVLRDFISTHTGSLLYLDTDTVFNQKIEPLFELIEKGHTFVMHENEGVVSTQKNLIFKKVYKFLSARQTGISPHMTMYNAGVLGLRTEDASVVEQVLSTTDRLYRLFPKHIIEQMAFSFHLAQGAQAPLYCATQEIFHYWDFKEFRELLNAFFRSHQGQPYQQIIPQMGVIDPRELIVDKRRFDQLPGLTRRLYKLVGKRWKLPPYPAQ